MSRLAAAFALLFVACSSTSTIPKPTPPPPEPSMSSLAKLRIAELVDRIGTEVDCQEPAWRFLCVVAAIDPKASAPALPVPSAPQLLAGLSIGLRPSRIITDGAEETLRYVVGEVGPRGIWTAEPGGVDASSRDLIAASRVRMVRMFGGLEPILNELVPQPIVKALTQPSPLPSPLTPDGGGWQIDGGMVYAVRASDLHPAAWIYVEPSGQGARLRILLDPATP